MNKKDAIINIRVPHQIKKKAARHFESQGRTLSTAILMFLVQSLEDKERVCFKIRQT